MENKKYLDESKYKKTKKGISLVGILFLIIGLSASGLLLYSGITTQKKIKGSVLCEHLRSIDFANRQVNFVEKATENDLLSVMMLVNACIEE